MALDELLFIKIQKLLAVTIQDAVTVDGTKLDTDSGPATLCLNTSSACLHVPPPPNKHFTGNFPPQFVLTNYLCPASVPGADAALNRVKWTVAWQGRLIRLKVTFKAFINELRSREPNIHCRNKTPPWWLKRLYLKVGGKILPRLEAIQVIRVCARRLGTFRLLQRINRSRSEQINPILHVQIWPECN